MLTSFDGGRIFGQVHGAGAPRVVALHGWARDHRDFARVLGGTRNDGSQHGDLPLRKDAVDAIALDLPGFGASPAPDEAWGAAEYAEAVAAVLRDLDDPVVVIGHSFGGRVAVELAASFPHEVCGLVLTGAPLYPAGPPPRGPFGYRMIRSLERRGVVSQTRLERARERYGSADYRAASGVMRNVLVRAVAEEREEAYAPALKDITCPVELVWGEDDTAAPLHVASRIEDTLKAPTTMTVVAGVGHHTPLQAPGELRAALERLLGGRS